MRKLSLIVIASALLCLTACSATTVETLSPLEVDLPEVTLPSQDAAKGEAAEAGDPVKESSVDAASKPSANKPSSNNSNASSNSDSNAQTYAHSWTYHEAQYDYIWHDAVTKDISVCNTCSADITGNTAAHAKAHVMKGENGGHSGKTIVIAPAYEEKVLVKSAYYSCSCGATK